MTVRQLFQSIPFDHLVPFIKQSDQPYDVCHYKQAYNILLHIEPCEEGCRDVNVALCTELKVPFESFPFISMLPLICSWRI